MQETYEDYPFSLKFLVQCILRCHSRIDHPTMFHAPNYLTKLLVLSFKTFQERILSEQELTSEYEFNSVITAPFSPLDLDPRLDLSANLTAQL